MAKDYPFIPYGKQLITQEDIAAVLAVLQSPFLTQGPVIPLFESSVAEKVGASYSVAVNSATSALHIACLALGLGPGDWLWTSPNTFVASANCACYCGADVDFVDIKPTTGLLDVDLLREKLAIAEQTNCLPKIVVPVHLTGSSCDMAAIKELSTQYKFYILEDASHAIGGKYKDSYVGSCRYSDICIFSFHPVKIITTGEGGMALTNSDLLAEKMRLFRSHGITKNVDQFQFQPQGPWSYEQQTLGFNYRMTDIQAALGLSQLNRLDEIVSERNRQKNIYRRLIENLPVHLLEVPKDVFSSVHLAVLKLDTLSPGVHRSLFESLRSYGIGVQLHYSPVHLQPYYQELGFCSGQFPNAEAYAKSALSLPLYPGLKQDEQKFVIQTISEFFQRMD